MKVVILSLLFSYGVVVYFHVKEILKVRRLRKELRIAYEEARMFIDRKRGKRYGHMSKVGRCPEDFGRGLK